MNPFDQGRAVDWGKTSTDYARYRPDPPKSFFERLHILGVGHRGQSVLDLGTGTGALARQFARQGAIVSGIDISAGQIEAAKQLATVQQLKIEFLVGPAEKTPFEDQSFDVISANQCWFYFDEARAIMEVQRLLKPEGVLVTSGFSWLPRKDRISYAMEQLVLKFNPVWSSGDWDGAIPPIPPWAVNNFVLRGMFYYDEPIPFTRETWRGRVRACRGVGAALSAEEVERFDRELAEQLEQSAPEEFTVLHRVDAHILGKLPA